MTEAGWFFGGGLRKRMGLGFSVILDRIFLTCQVVQTDIGQGVEPPSVSLLGTHVASRRKMKVL